MSAAPARHQSVNASGDVAVEVEVRGRWDALALSEELIPFHSFLVQYGPSGGSSTRDLPAATASRSMPRSR